MWPAGSTCWRLWRLWPKGLSPVASAPTKQVAALTNGQGQHSKGREQLQAKDDQPLEHLQMWERAWCQHFQSPSNAGVPTAFRLNRDSARCWRCCCWRCQLPCCSSRLRAAAAASLQARLGPQPQLHFQDHRRRPQTPPRVPHQRVHPRSCQQLLLGQRNGDPNPVAAGARGARTWAAHKAIGERVSQESMQPPVRCPASP